MVARIVNLERCFNLLVSGSVLSWGVLGLYRASANAELSVVRVCISALHFAVAVCFARRWPVVRGGSAGSIVVSVPSLALCGVVFRLSPSLSEWPIWAEVLFVLGTLFAVWSACTLGRSFAVLPAVRQLVVRGPYRYVRHPMYVGELLLVAGCVVAGTGWWPWVVALAILPCVMARIVVEERALLAAADYARYASTVKWRLVPGVW